MSTTKTTARTGTSIASFATARNMLAGAIHALQVAQQKRADREVQRFLATRGADVLTGYGFTPEQISRMQKAFRLSPE
jgi:hypothetical protein